MGTYNNVCDYRYVIYCSLYAIKPVKVVCSHIKNYTYDAKLIFPVKTAIHIIAKL